MYLKWISQIHIHGMLFQVQGADVLLTTHHKALRCSTNAKLKSYAGILEIHAKMESLYTSLKELLLLRWKNVL